MSSGKSVDFLFNQMRNFSGSLAAGTITFYYAGTTTLQKVYLDRDMQTEAANPYTLSADGSAELFGSGIYRVTVKDSTGVLCYDFDDVEILTSVTPSVTTGSTHIVYSVTTADVPHVLVPSYDQYITRVGDSLYTVQITPPIGYTFATDITAYNLYGDGETVELLLSGTVFHVVN